MLQQKYLLSLSADIPWRAPSSWLCLSSSLLGHPPQDHEDTSRDACDALPLLKPEVAELLEEQPVALIACLIIGKDPVEVEAEVHAEAEVYDLFLFLRSYSFLSDSNITTILNVLNNQLKIKKH